MGSLIIPDYLAAQPNLIPGSSDRVEREDIRASIEYARHVSSVNTHRIRQRH